MKKIIGLLILVMMFGFNHFLAAQQSVSIGTTSTDAGAVLWLVGDGNQGLILPITSNIATMPKTKGMVVYESTNNRVFVCDGTTWNQVGGGAAGASLLQISGNTITVGAGTGSTINLASGFSAASKGLLYWDGTNWTQAQLTLPSTTQALAWDATNNKWTFISASGLTNPMTANGDLIVGGSSGTPTRLANTGAGVLKSSGAASNLTWGQVNLSTDVTGTLPGSSVTPTFTQNVSTTGSISATGALTAGASTLSSLSVSGTTTFNTKSYTWPNTALVANTYLKTDALGNLTWSPLSATIDQTAQTGVLFGNGTAITGLAASAALQYLRRNSGNTAYEFATLTATDIPNLDASKITTGTLPVVRGGTGVTTAANGQLLIGNGTGFAANTLSAGTGINIANAAGSITIGTSGNFGSQSLSTTGSLTAGAASLSGLTISGATTTINGNSYTWPGGLAVANTVLTNDGAGSLSWAPVASFTNNNVIPKGSVSGLVASTIFDNGAGNVGIGTISPQAPLHINGTTIGGAKITNNLIGATGTDGLNIGVDGAGVTTIMNQESNNMVVGTGNNSILFLTPSGHVGINNNTPSFTLDISGDTRITNPSYGLTHTDGTATMSTYVGSGGVYGGSIGTQTDHPFFIYINNSGAKLTVGNSTNNFGVGIGVTTAANKLDVAGGMVIGSVYAGAATAPADGLLVQSNAGFGTTSPSGIFPITVQRTSGSTGLLQFNDAAGTFQGSITLSGLTVSYNAFTGSHLGAFEKENVSLMGRLITMTGQTVRSNGEASEPIYQIAESSKANDPKILGTYNDLNPGGKGEHLIMSVGNGEVWVIDNGQDLKVGDLLISSDVKGHAVKEDGSFDLANVFARVAEPVKWSEVTDTFEGKKHKRISILFESFIKNNKAEKLAADLDRTKAEMEKMKQEIENIKSILGMESKGKRKN